VLADRLRLDAINAARTEVGLSPSAPIAIIAVACAETGQQAETGRRPTNRTPSAVPPAPLISPTTYSRSALPPRGEYDTFVPPGESVASPIPELSRVNQCDLSLELGRRNLQCP
jgi:hypothetical protein